MFEQLDGNPANWHKLFYLAISGLGYSQWYQHPANEPLEWLGKASVILGVSACVANDVGVANLYVKMRRMVERAFDENDEAQRIAEAKRRAQASDMMITGGNVNIAVPLAQNVKRQSVMVSNNQVIPLVKFDKVRHVAITLIRQKQQGFKVDLTEKKWVDKRGFVEKEKRTVSNWKFSRDEFLQEVIDPWKYYKAIERAGQRKNASYDVVNWDVIELYAKGERLPPLPR